MSGGLCQADVAVTEDLIVADAERLDPALLTAGQCDEEPELDQLGLGEVFVQVGPELVVCDVGVPEDCAGVTKRNLLPIRVTTGGLKFQQVGVVGFFEALPSSLDGALCPSVVALDRL